MVFLLRGLLSLRALQFGLPHLADGFRDCLRKGAGNRVHIHRHAIQATDEEAFVDDELTHFGALGQLINGHDSIQMDLAHAWHRCAHKAVPTGKTGDVDLQLITARGSRAGLR